MSATKTTVDKKAGAAKAASAAAGAQQRYNESAKAKSAAASAGKPSSGDALSNPMYFENIDPSSVKVAIGKDKKLYVSFEPVGGATKSGNQRQNNTDPYLCEMLVGANSRLSVEGNAGTTYDDNTKIFTRTGATYNISLRIGTTASGVGGAELEARQKKALKWIFEVECAILGKLFDLNLPEWEGPIKEAKDVAKRTLWTKIKDEKGKMVPDEIALERLLESKSAAAATANKLIDDFARQEFIKLPMKKNIQCKPIYDDARAIIGYTELYAHRKVYAFIEGRYSEGNPNKLANGPAVSVLPSTFDNWDAIMREMRAIDRVYQYPFRLMNGGKEVDYQEATYYTETIHPVTGERTKTAMKIRDPCWNPLLENKKGEKLDTLAVCQIQFRIKRAKQSGNSNYGIKVSYNPMVRVICQEKRPFSDFDYAPTYATGMLQDDPSEDGEVVHVPTQRPAAAESEAPVQDGAAEEQQEEEEAAQEEQQEAVPEEAAAEEAGVEEDGAAEEQAAADDQADGGDGEEKAGEDEQDEADQLMAEEEEAALEAERAAAEQEAARLAAEEAERQAKAKVAGVKRKPAAPTPAAKKTRE
jgi:hypothetical protein